MDIQIMRRPPPATTREAQRMAVSTQGIERQLDNGGAWYLRAHHLGEKPRLTWRPLRPFHGVQSHE